MGRGLLVLLTQVCPRAAVVLFIGLAQTAATHWITNIPSVHNIRVNNVYALFHRLMKKVGKKSTLRQNSIYWARALVRMTSIMRDDITVNQAGLGSDRLRHIR